MTDHDEPHEPVRGTHKAAETETGTDDESRGLLGALDSTEPAVQTRQGTEHKTDSQPQHEPVDVKTSEARTTRTDDVRWRDLPSKGQLTVLTLARLSEPIVQTSLQSYMFYQLRSFQPDLSPAVVAGQAGVLQASFTATQFLTAMAWGRLADSPRFGRKRVVMLGLVGTMVSCVGFGFAQTFAQALVFRALGGATNGNVGVLRTMISEIVREKRFQSRAFLIMPMTFNVGTVLGPVLGGLLSDPAQTYPARFGDSAFFTAYPYAAPNLLSALLLLVALVGIWLGLEETLDAKRGEHDAGLALGRRLVAIVRPRPATPHHDYVPLATHAQSTRDVWDTGDTRHCGETDDTATPSDVPARQVRPRYTQRLPFARIFTPNVVLTLLAQAIYNVHMGTFQTLWFTFLSTPVYTPDAGVPAAPAAPATKPFAFTGGIGMPPRDVGLAMAILGGLGIAMQLLLFPAVSARLGTVRVWRLFLVCFPVAYFAMPFLSLVPSRSAPPHAKDGVLIWLAIAAVLVVQVAGRTFALPSQTILVNNSAPHPSVLGTLHGLGQSTSSLAKTIGPLVFGYVYGWGLEHGFIGIAFWCLSLVAVLGCLASLVVYEGNGHEIWLEGDVDESHQ